ncbi:417_t:CDS:2, partial [Entrophospora sp. SA101]
MFKKIIKTHQNYNRKCIQNYIIGYQYRQISKSIFQFNRFSDLVTKVRESYPISEITPKELHDMISKAPKPIILDVREKDERSNGIIPTAIPLSRGVLERDVERKVISMDEVN